VAKSMDNQLNDSKRMIQKLSLGWLNVGQQHVDREREARHICQEARRNCALVDLSSFGKGGDAKIASGSIKMDGGSLCPLV
jgi:hypothetical protein